MGEDVFMTDTRMDEMLEGDTFSVKVWRLIKKNWAVILAGIIIFFMFGFVYKKFFFV